MSDKKCEEGNSRRVWQLSKMSNNMDLALALLTFWTEILRAWFRLRLRDDAG